MGPQPPLIYNSRAEVDIHPPHPLTLVLRGALEALATQGDGGVTGITWGVAKLIFSYSLLNQGVFWKNISCTQLRLDENHQLPLVAASEPLLNGAHGLPFRPKDSMTSPVICGFHDARDTDVFYWVTHLPPSVDCELWEDKGSAGSPQGTLRA